MTQADKSLDDMTEPELNEVLTRACKAIKAELPPNTGFIVLAAPFKGPIAQYASNVNRADAAAWMAETLVRWDDGNYIER